jgi:hypothetical protein
MAMDTSHAAAVRRKPRPRPHSIPELLTREREVWSELTSTWRGLPLEALLRPGACGPTWSVKDVMAHLSAWMEAALRVLPELAAGRQATAGHGTDRFNAIHYERNRHLSLGTVRRRLNANRRALLAMIQSLPPEQVLDVRGRIGSWVKYSTYAHYGEHIRSLSEFREKALRGGRRRD